MTRKAWDNECRFVVAVGAFTLAMATVLLFDRCAPVPQPTLLVEDSARVVPQRVSRLPITEVEPYLDGHGAVQYRPITRFTPTPRPTVTPTWLDLRIEDNRRAHQYFKKLKDEEIDRQRKAVTP